MMHQRKRNEFPSGSHTRPHRARVLLSPRLRLLLPPLLLRAPLPVLLHFRQRPLSRRLSLTHLPACWHFPTQRFVDRAPGGSPQHGADFRLLRRPRSPHQFSRRSCAMPVTAAAMLTSNHRKRRRLTTHRLTVVATECLRHIAGGSSRRWSS